MQPVVIIFPRFNAYTILVAPGSHWLKQQTQESVEEDAFRNISELYEKHADIWENHNYCKRHIARLFCLVSYTTNEYGL